VPKAGTYTLVIWVEDGTHGDFGKEIPVELDPIQ